MDLDLLVIGSGPSGQKAAIQAAKLGKRVAVVERRQRLGGVSIHTGTIPSKTLRVAVLDELARRPLDVPDPLNPEGKERQAIEFLMDRTARVVGAEAQVVREQFRRNRVGLLFGEAAFVDEHTVCIRDDDDGVKEVTADNIIIATGTSPARPKDVEFDDQTIIDSDGLLHIQQRLPRSMTVVGAGVIGVEYASMFGRLGTKVTVVDQRPRVLTFLDGEIGEALQFILRRNNVTFRLNEAVKSVAMHRQGDRHAPRLGQGRRLGDRALRDRPPGRHRQPGARQGRHRGRQARAHLGRRRVPHGRAPHLRGRRLHGRLRPRRHGDGAGPPGRAARVRPARLDRCPSCCRPASTRSPSSRWSAAPRRT